MNACFCTLLAVAFALAGCGEGRPAKSPPSERKGFLPSIAVPPAGKGSSATAAPPPPGTRPAPSTAAVFIKPGEKDADGKDVGLNTINEALQQFMEDAQRLPASLEELIKVGRLARIPIPPQGKKYALDPEKKEAVLVSE